MRSSFTSHQPRLIRVSSFHKSNQESHWSLIKRVEFELNETTRTRPGPHHPHAHPSSWLVLEPWITPSLFYQFMSSDVKWGADAPDHTGFDSKTFCTALGVTEA